MRPRAGRLRHKVNLQQPSNTRDAHGGVIKGWSTVATVRAGIEPLSGRELFQADQVASQARVRVVIRYGSPWSGIDSSWRVVDANTSRMYAIESVINHNMTNDMITLMCSEGDKDDE